MRALAALLLLAGTAGAQIFPTTPNLGLALGPDARMNGNWSILDQVVGTAGAGIIGTPGQATFIQSSGHGVLGQPYLVLGNPNPVTQRDKIVSIPNFLVVGGDTGAVTTNGPSGDISSAQDSVTLGTGTCVGDTTPNTCEFSAGDFTTAHPSTDNRGGQCSDGFPQWCWCNGQCGPGWVGFGTPGVANCPANDRNCLNRILTTDSNLFDLGGIVDGIVTWTNSGNTGATTRNLGQGEDVQALTTFSPAHTSTGTDMTLLGFNGASLGANFVPIDGAGTIAVTSAVNGVNFGMQVGQGASLPTVNVLNVPAVTHGPCTCTANSDCSSFFISTGTCNTTTHLCTIGRTQCSTNSDCNTGQTCTNGDVTAWTGLNIVDETPGIQTNAGCTAANLPSTCCTGAGTGTCDATNHTRYAIRSQMNAGLPANNVKYSLFFDGTAPNALVGALRLGDTTVATHPLEVKGGQLTNPLILSTYSNVAPPTGANTRALFQFSDSYTDAPASANHIFAGVSMNPTITCNITAGLFNGCTYNGVLTTGNYTDTSAGTLDGATVKAVSMQDTITTAASTANSGAMGVDFNPTIVSTAAGTAPGFIIFPIDAHPLIQYNVGSGTATKALYTPFTDGSTLQNVLAGGTFTTTRYDSFRATPTFTQTAGTLSTGTWATFHALNATLNGGATISTQVGLDVDAISNGTTNIGIRNASTTVNTPSAAQTLAAATAILCNATVVQVTQTSGVSITLTANPLIAAGQDGQRCTILNVSTTAANSFVMPNGNNTRLPGATNFTLNGHGGAIDLVYSATLSLWVAVGNSA